MRKISVKDSIGIIQNHIKKEDILDRNIIGFFKKQFKGDLLLTTSGEQALQALIEDFELKNSEIILPSFICSDVFTRVFAKNNITPKLVDCSPTSLNIELKNAKKELTKKTKAILIVHTLGIPCQPEEFRKFCNKNKILLIEDCAHSISLKYKDKYLGSYGDASIFSFVKEMPNFAGGMYLNNKRKINSQVLSKVSIYKYSKSTLVNLLHKFWISRLLSRKSNQNNSKFHNTKEKHHISTISRPPKLSKAIFCHYYQNLDIEHKRKIATRLYDSILKQNSSKIHSAVNKKEIASFSAKSFPLIVKNRDELLRKVYNLGLNPGIGWTPVFSNNTESMKLWNLKKNPNSEMYSKELLTISLDELTNNRLDMLLRLFKVF